MRSFSGHAADLLGWELDLRGLWCRMRPVSLICVFFFFLFFFFLIDVFASRLRVLLCGALLCGFSDMGEGPGCCCSALAGPARR